MNPGSSLEGSLNEGSKRVRVRKEEEMTEQKIHLGMQMPSGAGKGKKKKGGVGSLGSLRETPALRTP